MCILGLTFDVQIEICCRTVPETLVHAGIWPSSPSHPKIGFSIDFLSLYYSLLLEGHVSTQTYIHAVAFNNGSNRSRVSLCTILYVEA